MAIQKKPTIHELGAVMTAVGRAMRLHGLVLGAVLDGESRDMLVAGIEDELDCSTERAQELAEIDEDELLELLQDLTLVMAPRERG